MITSILTLMFNLYRGYSDSQKNVAKNYCNQGRPGQGGVLQGAGQFFHDQMIPPVRSNGKGCLPPRSAKAAGSYCFKELVLPAGGKMRGRCRLAARVPMIGHLVVEKIAPPPEGPVAGAGPRLAAIGTYF